ncbi:AMP-dependent synthetase [Humibacillus sp. DSM 29435]|uniref:o-succinylbenzoate--CoA ligase n=1 Tax=Humibacillus sp. DSM 29435 TaxID=1869167 RepID=UPI000872ECC8|nr:o-succinylbenzoate--CoA ligase [Humibacillus sp. DSM 29435]OFE14936.1 AMP-dependent synthetase [Humibacillus sp. DSM 29435]
MNSAALLPLAVPAGPELLTILPALEAALAGKAPVLPYAAACDRPVIDSADGVDLPDDLAVVVATSGSTGNPKRALLTAGAVERSAWATHQVLGGSGAWLLAMPGHHIAGLQVLLRSIAAGVAPVVLDLRDGFSSAAFAAAAGKVTTTATARHRYTAIVPTQLARLLDDPEGTKALCDFDAVLVGGAATPAPLVDRAHRAGIPVRLTYGMSETAGGCVYDGAPLPVSRVHIDNDHHIVLGGDTVAHGYLSDPGRSADAFAVDADGIRWFRTDDLGHFDDDELLVVDGRADDVINSGGVKITPGVVEDAILRHLPEILDVVVVGLPDREWGEIVCAAVTLVDPADQVAERSVRDRLRGILPDAALPRRVLALTSLPQQGPGKPDREAVRRVMHDLT